MQLEYIFQNPLVILVVLFGMSCTMGLAVIIPIVANVMLAVFGGWLGDVAESTAKGTTPGGTFPDEREDFPKQVVGWGPEGPPKQSAPGKVDVEPDNVPTGMLTKLTVAVTIMAAAAVLLAMAMFDRLVADEMVEKGYTTVEAVPHAAAE